MAPEQGEVGGGAVSVPVAVAILAMLMLGGLAVDGVRAAQASADASAIAEEAARAAAQTLDPVELARGQVRIDVGQGAVAADAYLRAAGAEGSSEVVDGDRVRVNASVSRPTVLLGLIGMSQVVGHGSGDAVAVPVVPDPGAP
jgi:Flp pilus assembly protein TadG